MRTRSPSANVSQRALASGNPAGYHVSGLPRRGMTTDPAMMHDRNESRRLVHEGTAAANRDRYRVLRLGVG
jgi:hypothetical protein